MEIKEELISSKIMIVDDSPEMIDILHSMLPKNIKRQVALNGKYAIKLLNNSFDLPDLILLDVIMPEVNGFEACKKIKEDDRLKEIPIIFISSLNETFDKVKAFEVGAVDYITKPFQKEEVIARINAHLEISHSKKVIKDLYSETIQGIIGAMNDMLALANPEVGKVSNSMRLYSEMIMKELNIGDTWDLKLACVLSGLGMLSESIKKGGQSCGIKLEKGNYIQIDRAYISLSLTYEIISKIPKFEAVTNIIEKGMYPLEKMHWRTSAKDMESESLKGHILRLLIYYLNRFEIEKNYSKILEEMKESRKEFFSADVLDALVNVQNSLINRKILDLEMHELMPGMILVEDLYCSDGRLMLKCGYELSRETIMLIRNFKELKDVKTRVMEN